MVKEKKKRERRRKRRRGGMTLLVLLLLAFLAGIHVGYRVNEKRYASEETEGTQPMGEVDAAIEAAYLTENEDPFVVCLDAGHGFDDPGCESYLLCAQESEITLAITMLLKEKLESEGVEVVLTHDGMQFPSVQSIASIADTYGVVYDPDRFVDDNIFSPYERVTYASALYAQEEFDLFLSLHINSIEGYPEISQYELYYYEENPSATELNALCCSLNATLDKETKIGVTNYEDSYIVTKYCEFPSLLIEMGYATNMEDAQNLNSTAWRAEFCDTLCQEILFWLGEKESC